MDVAPGTLVVYSDVGCPWAHAAVARLHRARTRLGLDGRVVFDHRTFPLELFNERPTPKLTLDAEIPVAGGLEPDAGWQLWTGPVHEYPVSTLLALEAVQAAKEQGIEGSERLDFGLRRAFFAESRCITMRHVILAVAAERGLDAAALAVALDGGRARASVLAQCEVAKGDEVEGSPHVFAPDGTSAHNPGVQMHWEGGHGGFPVIDSDDRSAVDSLLHAAAD
jgi:predicted DsbA family dithiol-disulfide isomerase